MTHSDQPDYTHLQCIQYALGYSALGHILVASNMVGVCAILMGDEPNTLVSDLQTRFPRLSLLPGKDLVKTYLDVILAYIESPSAKIDLPFVLQGTDFQQRVWQALCQIPKGKTVSYTDIAVQLGVPKSARAVAQACAANPVALLVPCHRVIGRDGAVSGYRWGIERKKMLLQREQESAQQV